jgi:hypothetical protein
MKIKNISNERIYLKDLKFINQSQTEGRRGEDRYLAPGGSVYLPDTSEVLRSVQFGDVYKFKIAGKITVNDTVALAANGSPGDSITITHNLHYPPTLVVLEQAGITWVATSNVSIVHDATFSNVTIENSSAGSLTFIIRVG